jgi:hypothetical protein
MKSSLPMDALADDGLFPCKLTLDSTDVSVSAPPDPIYVMIGRKQILQPSKMGLGGELQEALEVFACFVTHLDAETDTHINNHCSRLPPVWFSHPMCGNATDVPLLPGIPLGAQLDFFMASSSSSSVGMHSSILPFEIQAHFHTAPAAIAPTPENQNEVLASATKQAFFLINPATIFRTISCGGSLEQRIDLRDTHFNLLPVRIIISSCSSAPNAATATVIGHLRITQPVVKPTDTFDEWWGAHGTRLYTHQHDQREGEQEWEEEEEVVVIMQGVSMPPAILQQVPLCQLYHRLRSTDYWLYISISLSSH